MCDFHIISWKQFKKTLSFLQDLVMKLIQYVDTKDLLMKLIQFINIIEFYWFRVNNEEGAYIE